MTKISELTSIVTAAATDIIAVVQGGVTKKATIQDYIDDGVLAALRPSVVPITTDVALAAGNDGQLFVSEAADRKTVTLPDVTGAFSARVLATRNKMRVMTGGGIRYVNKGVIGTAVLGDGFDHYDNVLLPEQSFALYDGQLTQGPNALAWSGSVFVAIDPNGSLATSTDGANWVYATAGTLANQTWASVAWSPQLGLFAAVSVGGVGSRIATSPNGTAWTLRTGTDIGAWSSIVWSPELGIFVVVSTTSQAAISSDGITWTPVSLGASSQWRSVAWSPDLSLFVAVANSGTYRVTVSPDGTNWSPVAAALSSTSPYGVVWSSVHQMFAAIINAGSPSMIYTSTDGLTWTATDSPALGGGFAIAHAPAGVFFALTQQGDAITSRDGVNWDLTHVSPYYNAWRNVVWAPELGRFLGSAARRFLLTESALPPYLDPP